jgi:hypothetical protein
MEGLSAERERPVIDTKTGHVYPPITVGSYPVAAVVTG